METFPRRFFTALLLLLLARLLVIAPTLAKLEGTKPVPPIVYAARYYTSQELTERSYTHLYLINPDGTGRKQITFAKKDSHDPRWSEDGRFIYFYRWRKGLPTERYQPVVDQHSSPIGATKVMEYWSFDTKTGKEQLMRHAPPIRWLDRPPKTLAMEQAIAKRFPGKTLSTCDVVRFPDGEQACFIRLVQKKPQRLPWTKPEYEYFPFVLVFDTRAKVVSQIRLKDSYVRVVGRSPKTRGLILNMSGSLYLADRNTGTLTSLGVSTQTGRVATSAQIVMSPDGKHFVATKSDGNYAMFYPPDSKGKHKLGLWDREGRKPSTKYISNFSASVNSLLVGPIEIGGKGTLRPVVSGLVDIGSCDWRGGQVLQ